MRIAAAALIVLVLLTGCATPGPLENGRWFLPVTGESNPFIIVLRSVANVGLASVYVAACAVQIFKDSSGRREREEQEFQLTKSPP